MRIIESDEFKSMLADIDSSPNNAILTILADIGEKDHLKNVGCGIYSNGEAPSIDHMASMVGLLFAYVADIAVECALNDEAGTGLSEEELHEAFCTLVMLHANKAAEELTARERAKLN